MNWKVVLAILTCNIFFMSASYTMIVPFLPLYLTNELGVAQESVNLWSGVVFSATFLVSMFAAPVWGRLADTRGKRLMAMRASFCLSLGYLLCGLVKTPMELVGARMFMGFASGLWPMDLAIMTLVAPKEKLGWCLGVMQGVLTGSGVIGPLLGGALAEIFGMRVSFYIAAAALFLNFLIFTFVIKEPQASLRAMAEARKKKREKKSEPSVLRMPLLRNMLFCGALVQMTIMVLQPILTTYVEQLAGEMENLVFVAGAVFSLGGIAGALAAPFWGKFGQRRGFFRSMVLALFLAGLSMMVQGTAQALLPFAVMQFICGLFFCGVQPSINAVLAEHSAPSVKGRIFGVLFSAQQVGSMAGPLLGGLVATALGMHAVFFVAGAILLLLGLAVQQKYLKVQGEMA